MIKPIELKSYSDFKIGETISYLGQSFIVLSIKKGFINTYSIDPVFYTID